MKQYAPVGEPAEGEMRQIPEECDFEKRLVNCHSRSDCSYYLVGEGEIVCPLALIRSNIQIMFSREEE